MIPFQRSTASLVEARITLCNAMLASKVPLGTTAKGWTYTEGPHTYIYIIYYIVWAPPIGPSLGTYRKEKHTHFGK
jgi:hypothetical protein